MSRIVFLLLALVVGMSVKSQDRQPFNLMVYAMVGNNLDDNIEEELVDLLTDPDSESNDVSAFVQMKYSSPDGLKQQISRALNTLEMKYIPGGKPGQVYRYQLTYDRLPETQQKNCYHYLNLTDNDLWGDSKAEMFQPDSVASFVRYCKNEAPADNYILILTGHGTGWAVEDPDELYPNICQSHIAVLTDDNLQQRAMTARELRQGLERAGVHLKLLYLDCCMLNNIEFLSELTGVTDYVMASGHTNRGGSYEHLQTALQNIVEGGDFEREMSAYLDSVAAQHNDYLPEDKDTKVPLNKDFVLTDMRKLPAVWEPMHRFVNYLCTHLSNKSSDYISPSSKCYQFFNDAPMYDLLDYCRQLVEGPYKDSEELRAIYDDLKHAIQAAQVHHAYALDHTDLKVDYPLSYSITLGAKGKIIAYFEEQRIDDLLGYLCYDNLGQPVLWQASINKYITIDWAMPNPQLVWANTILPTEFERRTGWSRWLMKNPMMPFHNPPYDDKYDHYRK